MEAEKSHDWSRKAGGVALVYTQRPKNKGANGVSPSVNPKAQEPEALMSEGRRR